MGSTVWGADVAQLRTLAQTFGKASENLLQQSSQLGQSINSAQAWKGPDAVRFKSEWNSSHRTVLMNAASALKKQSRFLLTQADEQETASNAAAAFMAPASSSVMKALSFVLALARAIAAEVSAVLVILPEQISAAACAAVRVSRSGAA